jgi:hypothetical protein
MEFQCLGICVVYMIIGYWPFGSLPCDLWLCLDYVMSNASALHLLLICMDRFFSAKRPLTYRANRTSSKVLKMIIISWIISVLLWLPWIFAIPYVEGGRTVPENECYIQFLHSNDAVTIVTHVLAFWAILSLDVCLSSFLRFWSCSEHVDMLSADLYPLLIVYKTLSAILLAFIVTWMPYHVNVIISCFCVDCVPNAFYHFGMYLYCLNVNCEGLSTKHGKITQILTNNFL